MSDLKDIKKSEGIVDKIKNLPLFQKHKEEEQPLVVTSPIEDTTVYSNEDVWTAIKRNYVNMGKVLDSASSYEDILLLTQKADAFNKITQNIIKGIQDNYDEQNRQKEYELKQEELRIRKAHEINETLKLVKGNKEVGANIVNDVMNFLAPPIEAQVKHIEAKEGSEDITR